MQSIAQKYAQIWSTAARCAFPPEQDDFLAAASRFELTENQDIEEFCLALACNARDARALSFFDSDYLSCGAAVLRSSGYAPHTVEDSVQRLRGDLLVTREGEKYIRLLSYAGSGRLCSLIRVSCVRYAKYLVGYFEKGSSTVKQQLGVAGDGVDLVCELWTTSDPESHVIQEHLKQEFKTCFENALLSLSAEDRSLLRLYYVQQMPMATLAHLYGLDKSTVSRRLTKIRNRLLRNINARWSTPIEDVTELLDGELDLSMSRLLREADQRESSGK